MPAQRRAVAIQVARQPTTTTCGPTCLHAVYRFFGESITLGQVVDDIRALEGGGTLAVTLACHALRRGYRARIYTYNVQLFDPTWFVAGKASHISDRLRAQRRAKGHDRRLFAATEAYLEFFKLGGHLMHHELTSELIRSYLDRGIPILTGLSATYLYGCSRELHEQDDDINGEPQGHFVVLSGYDRKKKTVRVADPLHDNPRFATPIYNVSMDRLKASILLGIVTYDANLLVLEPPRPRA